MPEGWDGEMSRQQVRQPHGDRPTSRATLGGNQQRHDEPGEVIAIVHHAGRLQRLVQQLERTCVRIELPEQCGQCLQAIQQLRHCLVRR